MAYYITFCENYNRVIPACIIDSRATIPVIKNETGNIIKAYVDAQLALITDNVLVYRIETELGVLAGYFALEINGNSATVNMKVLRSAFQQFDTQISTNISNFIGNGYWQRDYMV